MILGLPNKSYGLQLRKPAAKEEPKVQKRNVFGAEDDDDDAPPLAAAAAKGGAAAAEREAVNRAFQGHAESAHQKRQEERAAEQLKAAGLLEFDDWLDKKTREEAKQESAKREANKKAKYIEMRMAAQKQRQLELDILKERRLKKEREEEEKELGQPEEAFVTSAWKEKLAEMEHYQTELSARDKADDLRAAKTDFAGSLLKFRTNVGLGPREPATDDKAEAEEEEDEELQIGMIAELVLPKHNKGKKGAAQTPGAAAPPQPPGKEGQEGGEALPPQLEMLVDGEADGSDDESDEEAEEGEEAAARDRARPAGEAAAAEPAEGAEPGDAAAPSEAGALEVNEQEAVSRLERRRRRWERRTVGAELFQAHQRFIARQLAREKLIAALPVPPPKAKK